MILQPWAGAVDLSLRKIMQQRMEECREKRYGVLLPTGTVIECGVMVAGRCGWSIHNAARDATTKEVKAIRRAMKLLGYSLRTVRTDRLRYLLSKRVK